jgi:hypothetical protein
MQIKKYIFQIIILLLPFIGKAQDSATHFLPDKIYLPCNSCFTLNNSLVPVSKLKNYLQTNAASLKFYQQSIRREKLSRIFGIVGILGILTSAVIVTDNEQHIASIVSVSSVVSVITGFVIHKGAEKKLYNAVNIYNLTH